MIELKHERIALAAVNAGTVAQELNEQRRPLGSDLLLAAMGSGDVALAISRVVLLLIGRST
jgi:hypothetical protein